MQTIQFKVNNNYIEMVMNLLNSLNSMKLNIISDLSIVDMSKKQEDEMETLDRLFKQSNNKVMVTKKKAINTEEIIDDIS